MKRTFLLLLSLLTLHTGFSQSKTIPSERYALVRRFLETQKDFSGMVSIASGGAVAFQQGYGFADRENKVPFSGKTLYTIGSITKPFTATAIMLLLEQGKLHLKDPLSKYFSALPDDKKGITIHQLLTHSSGFPGAIGDDYEPIAKEDFLKRAWNTPLAFAPGTGYEYSNVGYSLLGMIIEQLNGMGYGAFLQKHIFAPAGMKTAGYTNPAADYKLLAQGYLADGKNWGTSKAKNWNGDEPYWNLKANGGLLMSAEDMTQWYRALRDNKILKPETLKLQTTPHVSEGGGSFYGYGYAIFGDGQSVEHNGGNGIFRADFRWFPALDICLFTASNDAKTRLFRLGDAIIDILMRGELPQNEQQEAWQPLAPEAFPADARQQSAKALLDVLAAFSPEKADDFIKKYYTPGIKERNGKERLLDILKILSRDSGGKPAQTILTSGQRIQLVLPGPEPGAKLKITLAFLGEKIDKVQAELMGD